MRGVHLTTVLLLTVVSLIAADGVDFFEKKIRPVLVEHCYKCHSAEAEDKLKGGLRLDLRDAIRAKGDSGKTVVVPGKPEESLIITALQYLNSDLQMPPKTRLPVSVVTDFRSWIKMGAPDPRDGKAITKEKMGFDFKKAREFWSFKPIGKTVVPKVKNKEKKICNM